MQDHLSVAIQPEPFDPGALLSQFTAGRTDAGGIVSFTGVARADAGPETRLTLEAYPGFTEREIERIRQQAIERFNLVDLLVVHRIGEIAAGETIVFVAAAARHRREAFQGADFMMDYLKSRAPFWKKEAGPEGSRWVQPSARDHSDATRWDLVICAATLEDHAALEALQARSSLASGEHTQQLQAHPEVITTDAEAIRTGRVLMAQKGAITLGFIVLGSARGAEVEIEGLFVDPDHWRQGVASRLLDAGETLARSVGAKGLRVDSGAYAEPFYLSRGFSAFGSAVTLFGPATVMRKLL